MSEKKFKNENFIQISGWMINDLDIKPIELIVYAIIYGFSQDGDGFFTGSLGYIQEGAKCSRTTAINTLKSLCEKELIIKDSKEINNVVFNKYKVNLNKKKYTKNQVNEICTGGTESVRGGVQNLYGGGTESVPNNKEYNKEYNKTIYESVDSSKQLELPIENKPLSLYSSCVDFWLKKIRPGWTFESVHGKKIKSIISKLRKINKEHGGDINDDNQILALFMKMMIDLPDWWKDKDLLKIDSDFNEIIQQIKNKRDGKQNSKNNYDAARNAFSEFA